mmetsp:Transcript_90739/g.242941  ORF Transcript_90739/g.242941 Transcript_90739/m.242941 type:complete len:717 (+) Transcript_90739:21-2171(+)
MTRLLLLPQLVLSCEPLPGQIRINSENGAECVPAERVLGPADAPIFAAPGDFVKPVNIGLRIDASALECVGHGTSTAARKGTDNSWVFTSGIRVLSMQGGFGLLESSTVRSTNSVNIMMKNMLDLMLGSLFYFYIGYQLTFGAGGNSFVGNLGAEFTDPIFFVFQWSFAATASTIDSGACAERVDLFGYVIVSAVTTGIIYPIVAHWGWTSEGWLAQEGYIDFAGSSIVHMVGGVSALLSSLCLGPRIGRFPKFRGFKSKPLQKIFMQHHHENYYRGLFTEVEKDTADINMGSRNPSQALFGTFLLWVAWYSFNCGSTLLVAGIAADLVGNVAITTTLSSCFSGLVGCLYDSWLGHRRCGYSVMRADTLTNCVLCGLVGITAGCAQVTYFGSIVIGLLSGCTYVLCVEWQNWAQIDDVVGAFPVHFGGGFVGTVLLGFFATDEPFGGVACGSGTPVYNGLFYGGDGTLLWLQLKGCLVIIAWTGATTWAMLYLIDLVKPIRVSRTIELVGLDLCEHAFFDSCKTKTNDRVDKYEALALEVAQRSPDFYATSEVLDLNTEAAAQMLHGQSLRHARAHGKNFGDTSTIQPSIEGFSQVQMQSHISEVSKSKSAVATEQAEAEDKFDPDMWFVPDMPLPPGVLRAQSLVAVTRKEGRSHTETHEPVDRAAESPAAASDKGVATRKLLAQSPSRTFGTGQRTKTMHSEARAGLESVVAMV